MPRRNPDKTSEKRTSDIISKIDRLKDGRIRFYQVKRNSEIDMILKFCKENNITAFVHCRASCYCYKLYTMDEYFSIDSEFYLHNSESLDTNNTIHICVFKGYSNSPYNKFRLVNPNPSTFHKL